MFSTIDSTAASMQDEKLAYFKLGGINKCIRFRSQAGRNDADCLREAIMRASVTDENLRLGLIGKRLIFQRKVVGKAPIKENTSVKTIYSERIYSLTLVSSPDAPAPCSKEGSCNNAIRTPPRALKERIHDKVS